MIIDCHTHWAPEPLIRDIGKYLFKSDSIQQVGDRLHIFRDGISILPVMGEDFYSIELKLETMNKFGVDVAVLTVDGLMDWLTIDLCRYVNDQMAEVVRRYPGRFIGTASVPPADEGCVEELDRAINTLGLKGVAINALVASKRLNLDSEELWPFYAKVNELDVPIVIHPANLPLDHDMFRDYELSRTFGRPVNTTLACVRLIQSRVLDEFPRLRFLVPHLGGTFFAMKERILTNFVYYGGAPIDVEARLDHFYFDTAPPFWTKVTFDCALAMLGSQRIVFGSDAPIRPGYPGRAMGMIEDWQLDAATREAVTSGNAKRLWGI